MVLEAMFVTAMLRGFHAVGLLTPRKLALPNARLHGLVSGGLATITNGKNRRVFGRIQIASIRDARCLRWLSWLLAGMDLDMRLLPGGTQKFRSIFSQIVKDLEIQDLGLTPASLRAGGATHAFSTQACDLGQLKFKGRWAALSTL
jgi:hypothetical protein